MNSSAILDILPALAMFAGPLLTYIVARRELGAKLLIADLQAVKDWSELRRSYETELKSLHDALAEEREKFREAKEKHNQQIEEIEEELMYLRELVREYRQRFEDDSE